MTKSILKHKSSIKLDKSLSSSSPSTSFASSSSLSTSSASSQKSITKNVRFDLFSTTIKRFDSDDEPITISTESSPIMSPIMFPNTDNNSNSSSTSIKGGKDIYCPNDNYSYYNHYLHSNSTQNSIKNEPCWFNNLNVLPNLINFDKKFNSFYKKNKLISSSSFDTCHTGSQSFYKQNDLSLSDFDLDYDDEDYQSVYDHDSHDDDNDDDVTLNNLDNIPSANNNSSYDNYLDDYDTNIDRKMTGNESLTYTNELLISDVDIKWKLIDSNVPIISQSLDLQNAQSIESYLNGQNIKLYKLEQPNLKENKLHGYLIVNNINFEKIIEIKFTFNNWIDIHYINSTYKRSLTSKFDEFQFVINLNCYKFFLQIKDLLSEYIKIDLCCRYDVGNETYFDNNNYQNYTLKLIKVNSETTEEVEEDKNSTNVHRIESLSSPDTTSSLQSGLSSSSSSSSSQYIDSQNFPIDSNVELLSHVVNSVQKNNNGCIDSYVNNSDINILNDPNNNTRTNRSGTKISAGTSKSLNTTTTNRQYNHSFLTNNKYIVPMTSRQFMNNRHIGHSRIFSETTDYYNTSPLKHLYHNDTCEFVKKPATINEVLNIETNPLPLPDTLPDPSISITKPHIDLLDFLNEQSNTVTTSTSNDTDPAKLPQDKTKQKDSTSNLAYPLEGRTSSTSSLSSGNSSVSFSSFQVDNSIAKKKNLSLTSSTLSFDSLSVPNLTTSLGRSGFISNNNTTINSDPNDIELESTDLYRNELNHSMKHMNPASNFLSRQNSGSSSSSSLMSDSITDFVDIQHPTMECFNSDLKVPFTSLNSKHALNQQDEVQSVDTDTTFKNPSITSNSNNNTKINNSSDKDLDDNILMPTSKFVSLLDNMNIDQMVDNSKSFSSITDDPNQYIPHSKKIHDNMIQSNFLKNMDYQHLLQSYCFYTSPPPPPNKDSMSSYSEIVPSSSPGSTLYL